MHEKLDPDLPSASESNQLRTTIADAIRSFVVEESNLQDTTLVKDNTDLLELGVIDSLLMVSLVTFCEVEFACTIEVDELTEDNFRSIASVVNFVTRKLGS